MLLEPQSLDQTSKPTACVVLPTYNEAANLPFVIPALFEQSSKIASHELHVLVVDDNSPDGTQGVVEVFRRTYANLHLLTGEKAGLGAAYKRGMNHALTVLDAAVVFEMDADLQHDPELIPLFLQLHAHGFSLVIGSRFAPGGATPEFGLDRKVISLVGNFLVRWLGGVPRIRDCTSGYRCIDSAVLRKCDLSGLATRGYSFQTSLLIELLRNGARVVELPIIFRPRKEGHSKLALQDQIEFLANLFRIRFRKGNEFLRFAVVGISGCIVNMGSYLLLSRIYGFQAEAAAALAIEIAILSNFLFSELWRLGSRPAGAGFVGRLVGHHHLALVAAGINYIVFILLSQGGVWDVGANLTGMILGIFANYSVNSFRTWQRS